MRADDVTTLVSVGRPTIAPDGAFAIFATSRPDIEANRNVGQLWRIELPDGAPRRLTRGVADSAPRLDATGDRLAFLRGDDKSRPQVFVVSSGGGEPVQATDAPVGVSEFAWSPDGAHLAFTARMPEAGRYGTVEGLGADAESPRRITGIRWHANGLGYLGDRPAQVFVVPTPSVDGEPFYEPAPALRGEGAEAPTRRRVPIEARQLTHGAASYSSPAFAGDEIIAVVDEIETDRRDLRSRVVAVKADGSGERDVVSREEGLSVNLVEVAPDGSLALLAADAGPTHVDFIAPAVALWLAGPGGLRRLTDPEQTDLGEVGSHVTAVGDDFLVQDRTRGRVRLLRVSRTGDVEEVLGGDVEVNAHAAAGERIVASVATPVSYGELVVIDGADARTASEFAAPAAASGIVVARELTVDGRDGYPVHGWVATPDGEGPFPVILQIHGGPYASYGIHLFDETQVLVDAGYAVVYSNPRGSAGYGRDHGRSR